MLQKMDSQYLYIKPMEKDEITKIKSWRMFKENKKEGIWYAELSKTMLEKVKSSCGLIPSADAELERLKRIQQAVDYIRTIPSEKVPDVADYPVKATLFIHQRRAVDMALLTFGVIDPSEVER